MKLDTHWRHRRFAPSIVAANRPGRRWHLPAITVFSLTVLASACVDQPKSIVAVPAVGGTVITLTNSGGDQTSSINTQLSNASNGDTVKLTSNTTYNFSGVISLPHGVTLMAATKGTSSTPNLQATSGTAYVAMGADSATLRDLYIKGTGSGSVSGVNVSSLDWGIYNVVVDGFGDSGVNTGSSQPGGELDHCELANNVHSGIQVATGTTEMHMTYCSVHGNGNNGIDINGSYMWIAYNDVYNNGTHYLSDPNDSDTNGILVWATPSASVKRVDIYSNTVHDNYRSGIEVTSGDSGGTNPSTVDSVWIAGNQTYGDSLQSGGAGIWVEGGLYGSSPLTLHTLVEYNGSHNNKWGYASGSGSSNHDSGTIVQNNYFPDNPRNGDSSQCGLYGAGVTATGNTTNGNASCND